MSTFREGSFTPDAVRRVLRCVGAPHVDVCCKLLMLTKYISDDDENLS